MKKILVCAALLIAGTALVNAEGYNRIGLSYNYSHYGFNKDYRSESDSKGIGYNGVGLNYIHGFGLSKSLPMFLEIGGNINFDLGTDAGKKETEGKYWIQPKQQYRNLNLQVPVNFAWKFKISDSFSISPYLGLNFKLHFLQESRFKLATNISSSELDDWGFDKEDLESKWYNLFSDKDMGKDGTWNRFQMGWHLGVGANFKKFYLGAQFGTDFIPAFSYSESKYKPKINTSNLKVSVGYSF